MATALHIMKPIATFAMDNKLAINPTITGHFAIRVSDLDAVRHRLRKAGVFSCDAGNFSMPGVRQIYLYDPSMNCIEIRSEEHTSELQSLMRISYAVFCLKKKKTPHHTHLTHHNIHYYTNLH